MDNDYRDIDTGLLMDNPCSDCGVRESASWQEEKKDAINTHPRCRKCLDKVAAQYRVRYKAKRSMGQCTRCKRPAKLGMSRCEQCRVRDNASTARSRKRAKQREMETKRKSQSASNIPMLDRVMNEYGDN